MEENASNSSILALLPRTKMTTDNFSPLLKNEK
jgi:hypothetical protein